MKFLCDCHREQTLQSPDYAIRQWDKLMRHGRNLVDMGHWQQAIPLVGSSFEISECLLAMPKVTQQPSDLSYCDRYLLAGHQLAECYRQQGSQPLELHILLSVHRTLLKMASCESSREWAIKANINESLYRIQRHIDFYGPFKGYSDLYEESREILRQFCH